MFGSRYVRTVLPHACLACCLTTALASAAVLPAQVLTSPLFAATDLRARSSGDNPAGATGQAVAAADQTLTSIAVTYMNETPAANPAIVAGAVSAAGPLPSDLIRYAVTSTMTCRMAPAPTARASADHCGA